MANIAPTETSLPDGGILYQWSPVTSADTPLATPEMLGIHDASFQAEGTFGGATTVLKGTLDGTNYEGLKDPANAAVSLAAAGLVGVRDKARKYKPTHSGGDGTESLTLSLLVMRRR
jgi:hypothetical protein